MDAAEYRALRLRALREHPDAFTSSFEEDQLKPVEWARQRLGHRPEAPHDFILGAYADGKLIGILGMSVDFRKKVRHIGEVFGMYVAPEYAGRGIGRLLVDACIVRAREAGLERLRLTVTNSNSRAKSLYGRAGFGAFGVERNAVKVDGRYFHKCHMVLALRSLAIAVCCFLIAAVAIPIVAIGASFDCRKAVTTVEKMICASPELSALDVRAARRYADAVATSPGANTLRRQQRDWLRNVRDRCADEACIRSAYQRRSEQFEWMTTFGRENALCEDLRVHKNRRAGLSAYAVPEEEHNDGDFTHAIRGVDIDGDKVEDRLLLFRSGSASLIPPDDSLFVMELSSSGREYRHEAQRLVVVRYQSVYYLLTGTPTEEGGVGDAYSLEGAGIRKVCSHECGMPYSYCAVD